jgi:hypothetical protein
MRNPLIKWIVYASKYPGQGFISHSWIGLLLCATYAMYGLTTLALVFAALPGLVSALTIPEVSDAAPVALKPRTTTQLTTAQIDSYAPYTQLARAAYCPSGIATWKCGGAFKDLFRPSHNIDQLISFLYAI